MSEEELIADASHLTGWEKHRFLVMIGASIVIALMLVAVSMKLYESSGAAQLDLSRPGYEHVNEKVTPSEVFKGFSAVGELDKAALDEFQKMYSKRAGQATNVDSFGGDVMNDAALGIDAPVGEPTQPAQ
ncbi:MAG: divTM7 [Candidatus Saccharibacteria bacterium]|nr:divTM7 [Candidatus Saccharibacteria bacterium]